MLSEGRSVACFHVCWTSQRAMNEFVKFHAALFAPLFSSIKNM